MTQQLPINYWDNWKVARDKINDSFNEVVERVASYRPHIENWYWYIWDTFTGVQAAWYKTDFKVQDWYIWYRTIPTGTWTELIALSELKWEKWDTGDTGNGIASTTFNADYTLTITYTDWTTFTTDPIRWAKGETWDTGASIVEAEFVDNDMVFTKDDWDTVTLEDAKIDLKWEQWEPWEQWEEWNGIESTVLNDDYTLTITFTDWTTYTTPSIRWQQGNQWEQWETGEDWNWIASITSSKSGKTTTITITQTSWNVMTFQVQDGSDWQGSWDMSKSTYDPTNKQADAFDYNNMYNKLTAWSGIDITNNVISNTQTSAEWWNIEGTLSNQTDLDDRFWDIEELIPNQATSSNQLADKDFVNSTIQTASANFRWNWNTWANVPTDSSLYPVDYAGNKVPTTNDYMVVQDASDYSWATLSWTWRFKYWGVWATDWKNGWNPEYQVNEAPLTAAQLAALNSWITSWKVSTYDWYASQIAWKQAIISDLETIKSNATAGKSASDTIATYWNIVTHNTSEFATYAQWAKADSALQSISSSDVTTALWYTPYNSTNPNLYQTAWEVSSAINAKVPATWNTWQVLTKTASGTAWQDASGWIQPAPQTPITITYKRVGTKAQFQALGSYDENTEYNVVE